MATVVKAREEGGEGFGEGEEGESRGEHGREGRGEELGGGVVGCVGVFLKFKNKKEKRKERNKKKILKNQSSFERKTKLCRKNLA